MCKPHSMLQNNCRAMQVSDSGDESSHFAEIVRPEIDHRCQVVQIVQSADSANMEEDCRILLLRLRNSFIWRFRISCPFCTEFLRHFFQTRYYFDDGCIRFWHFEVGFLKPQRPCVELSGTDPFAAVLNGFADYFQQCSLLIMSPREGTAYERVALALCTALVVCRIRLLAITVIVLLSNYLVTTITLVF